jgi:hypothetical protein
MSKYYCTVLIDASVNMEVEADTPEDAAEKAECSDQGQPSLCHHCSSDVDMGESYGVRVCTQDGMTELLDTTYTAKEVEKLKARLAAVEQELADLKAAYQQEHQARINCMESRKEICDAYESLKAAMGEPVVYINPDLDVELGKKPWMGPEWEPLYAKAKP